MLSITFLVVSHQLPSAAAREYASAVLADSAVVEWVAAALREQESGARAIAHYDEYTRSKGAALA